MYIVKEKTRVALIDDAGFTSYTAGNDRRTIYMPKDLFAERAQTLKNKPVNFEHEEGVAPRGIVIDVVHNLDGIQSFEGDILQADGEYYAILKINDELQEEANKIHSVSTEFHYIERVLKSNLTTSPYTKDIVEPDGTIDGIEFDIYCVDIEYEAIALTNNPKRTRLKERVYNSNTFEKKILDKNINPIIMNKFLNLPMEITEEKVKEMIKNFHFEVVKNSQEEAQKKQAAKDELMATIKNAIDEVLPEKIKNALDAYEKEKNSQEEVEKAEEEEEDKKEDKKDGEKNSVDYTASQIAKAANIVEGEKNSNTVEPANYWSSKIKII